MFKRIALLVLTNFAVMIAITVVINVLGALGVFGHGDFMRQYGPLVVISGHWEEPVVTIQNNPAPPLLYDYRGFPPSTYEIKFPAPGAPEVSARVAELLGAAGIAWKYDHDRGFDHGVFIPLKVVFPQANVPIVQVSLLAYPGRSSAGAAAR